MSELSFFRNENEVMIDIDDQGREWYRAADVCRELGFDPNKTSRILDTRVWAEYKEKRMIGTVGKPAWYVNEFGVYQLTTRSDTDAAKAFLRWLFEDVIPQIRSGGFYFHKQTLAKDDNYEKMLAEANEMKTQIDSLRKSLEDQKTENMKRVMEVIQQRELTEQERSLRLSAEEIAKETQLKALIESYTMEIAADLYATCEYCKPSLEYQFIEICSVSKRALRDLGLENAAKALDSAIDIFIEALSQDGVQRPGIRPKSYVYYVDDALGERILVQGIRRVGSDRTGKQEGHRLKKFKSANGMKPS